MKINEKIQQTCSTKLMQDARYRELEAFYRDALKNGIAKKSEYDLSPLDTVGREFYKNMVVRINITARG